MQKYVKWEINYQPPPRGAELVKKFNKWPGSCGKKPSAKSQNSARTGQILLGFRASTTITKRGCTTTAIGTMIHLFWYLPIM